MFWWRPTAGPPSTPMPSSPAPHPHGSAQEWRQDQGHCQPVLPSDGAESHDAVGLLSQGPGPPAAVIHDQAQWHPEILLLCLPQSTADVAQGLDAKVASPHPSPGPATWEGTQRRTLASSREGHWHVHHVSWVCVSVWHTCRRVPLVGVWVFNVSLLH